jgi:hypothetical protein
MNARPPAGGRWLAWGAVVALVYLAAVLWPGPSAQPVRVLYDGYVPPPPYRWVHPPAAVARGNQQPQDGTGIIALTPQGSAPAAIGTEDEQAVVVFPRGAITPLAGEPSVEVRLVPLDPAALGPAPKGLRFDGNAYRVTVAYTVSHKPAALALAVNIVLRYATGANAILRRAGSTWASVTATTIPIDFQVYGPTRDLGVFVAAGPPPHGVPLSVWVYRSVTVLLWGLVAVLLWLLIRDTLGRRRSGRRGPPARRTGPSGG